MQNLVTHDTLIQEHCNIIFLGSEGKYARINALTNERQDFL